MGRWKMGPNGGYWDGQDSGPDQMQPTPEMMQAAGQGAPAGPVPTAGQPGPQYDGMNSGGFTGGEPVARMKWEQQHPGEPWPGMKASMTPGSPADATPIGNELKRLPTGPMGPIDIMPGEGGQWNMGGQPYAFRDMLEAIRQQMGGGTGFDSGLRMLGGAAIGGGGNAGGGGLMGAIKSRIAPTAGGAPAMGAPQQSLSTMLQKRDPNEQMNLGAIGGAY